MKKDHSYKLNIWNHLSQNKGTGTLEYFYDVIKSTNFKRHVEFIKISNLNGDEKTALALKQSLPAITVSGIYKEKESRTSGNLIEYTGLMVLDIDKLESKLKVNEVFNNIVEINHTMLAFISPSGYGIKIIVRTNNVESNQHTYFYKKLVKHYEDILKVKLDSSTCDLSRLCFLSYDPNAYYNPNAKIFEFEELTNSQINLKNVQKTTEKIPDDSLFELKMKEAINFTTNAQPYEKGKRNNFVYLLAKNCSGYGLNESEVQNFIIDNYAEDDFSADEIQNSINSAYKSCVEDFGKWKTKLNQLVNLSQKKNKAKFNNKPTVENIPFEELVNHYTNVFFKNISKEDHDKFLTDDNIALGTVIAIEAIAKNEFQKMVC